MTTTLPAVFAAAPRRRFVFTACLAVSVVFLLALHAAICVVALPWTLAFDRDRVFAARLASWITRTALLVPRASRDAALALRSVRLQRPAVVVMNHRSMVDIAFAVAVPGGPKIVAKAWVARVPLLGLGMRLCGHVVVDTASRAGTRELVARVDDLLARGRSVLLFPEGTRRAASGLGPFASGAFRAAVENGVDVVPVVLRGTGEVVPKGSLVVRDGAVAVVPLPRVRPGADRRALARRVRAAMSAALAGA